MRRLAPALFLFLACVILQRAFAQAAPAKPRVLFIVAHQDFYYREYAEPRQELENAGCSVLVTAARPQCRPHPNTGQPAGSDGVIKTDLLLKDVNPDDYDALVFVGGWGASMYQPAFPGSYDNPAYQLDRADKDHVNRIVASLHARKAFLTAICHGVTALAWCRVPGPDGKPVSPLTGLQVAGYEGGGPACLIDNVRHPDNALPSNWHATRNGATQTPPRSVGNPATADDDVIVQATVITAQNYDSARAFGKTLAARLAKP